MVGRKRPMHRCGPGITKPRRRLDDGLGGLAAAYCRSTSSLERSLVSFLRSLTLLQPDCSNHHVDHTTNSSAEG